MLSFNLFFHLTKTYDKSLVDVVKAVLKINYVPCQRKARTEGELSIYLNFMRKLKFIVRDHC